MSDSTSQPVSVSRTIVAPASAIFAVLTRPASHPDIDGSGMLLESADDVIGGIGDIFTMKMHNGEMGDYMIANHVVEYEPGRRIGWEPVLAAASRPEDQGDIGVRSEIRWSYELTPLALMQPWCARHKTAPVRPRGYRRRSRAAADGSGPTTATLEKLDALARG